MRLASIGPVVLAEIDRLRALLERERARTLGLIRAAENPLIAGQIASVHELVETIEEEPVPR
jgi:hypothetical protein